MPRTLALWMILLVTIGALIACNSSPPIQSAKTGENLPFDAKQQKEGRVPTIPSAISVPAGTPISVRLLEPLSSESAKAGQAFRAVLDDPIVVKDITVVGRGSRVTGRVLAVRRAGTLQSGGILQLALDSVDTGTGRVTLQTSSVIAGTTPALPNSEGASTAAYARGRRVWVGPQRRLTFRLRQSAAITPAPGQRSAPPA
jgi:hypothetical protein